MKNLYEETVNFLAEYGRSIDDVVFVSGNGHEIPLDNFTEIARAFDYNDGYGAVEVPVDLRVVGRGWWLERQEYDGSEWWEYKTIPLRPKAVKKISGFVRWGEYRYDTKGAAQ